MDSLARLTVCWCVEGMDILEECQNPKAAGLNPGATSAERRACLMETWWGLSMRNADPSFRSGWRVAIR
ncbi:MAG: hypothetical protein WA734_06485, partial [Candidatus Acidiferrales bacterium]